MADVEVSYKGSTIGSLSASGTLTLETEGKYCEDDIGIAYTSPGGGGGISVDDIATNSAPSGAITLTVSSVAQYAFNNKTAITSVSAPNVTTVARNAFENCSSLASISFPELTTLNLYSFSGLAITTVYLPKLTTSGSYMFNNCKSLTTVVLPKAGGLGTNPFGINTSNGCTALKTVDVTAVSQLQGSQFQFCTALDTLILRRATRVSLQNVNAFANTKFASGGAGGTIYIPKSLYDHLGDGTSDDYKAASNWSTVDGYGTITWAKIEGSQYENYYADGTPIPT